MSTVGAVSTCSPYLQFRNVSLVTRECGACEQSKVLSVAAAFLIESYAARWELKLEFSYSNCLLISTFSTIRMQRVMSVIRKRPVCMITSTAPIMTQASSAMKEMFRQLDVDRMPIVEEEGEPDA
ncbi:hypothetical protein C8T65DRAFT_695621 [Cerioporus squamosus]|nr:hypothetical protein C8T65DRAFT_695621 [Cerioporus squamosus]